MGLPSYPPPPAPNAELERLKGWVSQYFPVYETRITPQSLVLLVHADPATLEDRFDRLRQELWPRQYVAQIRREGGEYVVEVVHRPPGSPWRSWVNLLLLGLTVLTTMAAGAFLWLAYVGHLTLQASDFLYGGIYFGLPVMAILGLHELAHYLVARRHHVEASLPFFLPVPPPFLIFGTFGAFISLREPIPSKKALLDIGAAGPLAGFAVAVPVTLGGLLLSAHAPVLPLDNCGPVILGASYGNLLIGSSFLWTMLSWFVPGASANLHPLAIAGWVGLLVTAMNLLPAGQLDGGHVFRALFGRRTTYVSIAAILLLLFLGLVSGYFGWILFGFLILFLGVRHPPPLNDLSPLGARRWAVGALAVAVLVSGFVIVPIAQPSGSISVSNAGWAPGALPGAINTSLSDRMSLSATDHDVVPYGLVLAGRIDSVVASTGNQSVPLSGAALTEYEANSTWIVEFPNGSRTMVHGSGTFSIPSRAFVRVDAGGTSEFVVQYSNTAQATISVTLTVTALCNAQGKAQSTSYQIH